VIEDIQCLLYCRLKINGGYSYTNITAWRDEIWSTSGTNLGMQAWCKVMEMITKDQWDFRAAIGELAPSSVCASLCLDCPDATVQFVTSSSSTTEGQQISVPVRLNLSAGVLASEVRVPIVIVPGGTATQDVDYTLQTSEVVFAAGSADGATQNVTLSILTDAVQESAETILLGFGVITGGAVAVEPSSHTVTIAGSDCASGTLTGDFYRYDAGWEGHFTASSDTGSTIWVLKPYYDITLNLPADVCVKTVKMYCYGNSTSGYWRTMHCELYRSGVLVATTPVIPTLGGVGCNHGNPTTWTLDQAVRADKIVFKADTYGGGQGTISHVFWCANVQWLA
jgi:hypothetical protein